MPKFLEEKLKKQYPNDKAAPYKIMNKMGAMKGNKITPKGKAMEAKHMKRKKKKAKAKGFLASHQAMSLK